MREAVLRVRRGAAGEPPRYDTFVVPYDEGMSVLDALMWVRRHQDSSLAVRYSCINANACKECSARVDGEVAYLCMARLREGEITVEPLATRALVRDLVTDIVPPRERLEDPSGER
jgi:succinate dehydrogenase/fumarate reductase-like Fe-S protein